MLLVLSVNMVKRKNKQFAASGRVDNCLGLRVSLLAQEYTLIQKKMYLSSEGKCFLD